MAWNWKCIWWIYTLLLCLYIVWVMFAFQVPIALVGESGNFASWLYIAAVKMNSLEKIETDLSELVEAMKTSPIFAQFTKDPSVPRETRLAAIVDVCDKAKFAEPTKNFLCNVTIDYLFCCYD